MRGRVESIDTLLNEDYCTFYGTEWQSDRLLTCGLPSVGVAKMELPIERDEPEYFAMCERHRDMYLNEFTILV